MAIFGAGNQKIGAQEIQGFLSGNTGLSSQQLLEQALKNGLSLEQIQTAVPDDSRFQNANALPFLQSVGINRPQEPITDPGTELGTGIDTELGTGLDTGPGPGPGTGIPTGLFGSELAIQGGLESALAGLLAGVGQNRRDISTGIGQVNTQIGNATQQLQPFTSAGQDSVGLQAALSGALGATKQAEAFANFNNSPGQDFLRDRGEKAVLRNSAATGGIGGGRVRQELQREGIGFAQQDILDQFDRLNKITGTGANAAAVQANLAGQGAGITGNLAGQQAAGSLNSGLTASQLGFDTGQLLSAGRTRVGEQIAGEVSNTTSALAALADSQGRGLSDLTNSTSGNLSNLLLAANQAQEAGQTQLATLLANLAVSEGSSTAAVRPLDGIMTNILDSIGKLASGFGAAAK